MKSSAIAVVVSIGFSLAPLAHASTLPCPHSWNSTLGLGSRGTDVLRLQQFLNRDPATAIATAGIGSPGQESTYFGEKTARAVTVFQERFAAELLTPAGHSGGTGVVGPRTRAKLNELCAALSQQSSEALSEENPALAVAPLVVSRGEQPTPTIAPAGAGGVPFTSFTLTAGAKDVTVRAIAALRTGAGADGAFEEIELVDESRGAGIGDAKVWNAHHGAVFNEPFTIPAGESKTYTVYAGMAEDLAEYDGQMPIVRIVSIDASVPVSGGLPIDGTAQTINASLVIGGATAARSSYDPEMDRTLYINETGVRFSGIRISANTQEDLELSGIEWEQAGSAGSDDIANVQTVIDGVAYPTERDGRVYASTFEPAIQIRRGMTLDAHVRGDILPGAANRTIKFDLYESGAISLTGLQYGFDVGIAAASHTGETGNSVFRTSDGTIDGEELHPFYSGSIVNVSSGGITSVSRN